MNGISQSSVLTSQEGGLGGHAQITLPNLCEFYKTQLKTQLWWVSF